MKLINILNNIQYKVIKGNLDVEVKDISYDSREVKEDYAFVCLIGIDSDGHNFIKNAIDNGANCIITCKDVDVKEDVTVVQINDTRTGLSYLSSNFFNNPSKDLIKIGITGTKGKTSTSWMIKSILEENNEKVGVIGTIGTFIDNKIFNHKNTTPESYQIQKFMRLMVDNGVKYLIMETSSTALKVGRINNIEFDYAIFSNLSIDHVGPREHPTYEDYVASKMKLFTQSKVGIINKDDKEFDNIKKIATCKLYSYGKNKESDYILNNIEFMNDKGFFGTKFNVNGLIKASYKVKAPGEFSAYNALSAVIVTKLLGIDDQIIKRGLENYYAEGRCEIINICNKFTVIIDYAHNKISMESIINTMKNYPHNNIITIFGCGGGRSFDRRYELGYVSSRLSDLSIITTDNPRFDNVDDIIKDIEKGIKSNNGKYKIIKDRKEAINYALSIAKKNDIILILGKGHEKFQEIKDIKYPFNEKQIVSEFIKTFPQQNGEI